MILASTLFEETLWNQGKSSVCGIDEVGRGCFAGPVVAAAVVFASDCLIPAGIADSKLLTPKKREKLAEEIKKNAKYYSIATISVGEINKHGIGKATQMAFRKAVRLLPVRPDHILIDAFYIKHFSRKNQSPIVKGDQKSVSIAAASIIAKVYRDNLMKKIADKYPKYSFEVHKGYGTKKHQEAIKKFGFCRIHRQSFNLEKFL